MLNTWTHKSTDTNVYWNSLSTMHTFVIILAFLELILKGLIVAYLVYDFKHKNPNELSELWKFSYIKELSGQSKNNLLIYSHIKILKYLHIYLEKQIGDHETGANNDNSNAPAMINNMEAESDFKNPY